MERWKEIEGTGGRLLVSDQGRIKSLLRDGRVLKATKDKKGYLRLRVTLDRKKYVFKVHRLVAAAFVPNPENKPQVNHLNGDKTDNRACNLEWVSNRENAQHAVKNGLWENVFVEAKKANELQKKPLIGYAPDGSVKYFESVCQAQREVGSKHITAVLKGRRKHAGGWSFCYAKGGDHPVHDNHRKTKREAAEISA